ncbi:EthD family reductase [Kineobactrum salinum]|uniref:EthD family reductase n=1 Tax=Kineobactrum salinum TaxID=2708301 RepID=A0A6C0TZJ4_9GAMM|nr:EthD family reductase [Kineobactrum salinum]QIB64953.1 EthD family reductase [Kineobactrum salinum]
MFKLTIVYPVTPEGVFDFDYYLDRHMPLSLTRQGAALKSVLVEKGYDGSMPGVSLAYVAICHFTYDSQETFLDAFLPHAEELQGDIANYTNITPVIQFSTVVLDQVDVSRVGAQP